MSANCSDCHDTGWAYGEDRIAGVKRCRCSYFRILTAKLEAIPPQFKDATFDTYKPKTELQRNAINSINDIPHGSYFIYGTYRQGKTHLAVSQYRLLVTCDQSAIFVSMAGLLAELQAAEIQDQTSQILQRARYSDRFHLFIDDIDKFKPTEFKSQVLFDLFDTLYRRKLSLTITSNMSLTELRNNEKLDGAVLRRIDDICQPLEV